MVKNFLKLILVSFLAVGCGGEDNSNSDNQNGRFGRFGGAGQRTTSVETQEVNRGAIAEQVRSYGNIKAQNVVSVVPQVSNRITNIYVDLGDTVSQGQVLARIYGATYRDQLNQAESQLIQSRIAMQRDSTQFERQKQLLDRNLSSQAEYDNARATYQNSLAQYQSAKASLTQARENFENTRVKSPVEGVIIARNLEEGDLATTGQAIFEIANTTGYETRVYLPVEDWRAVKIGQSVNLRVSNQPDFTAKGVVSRKSPQLDPTTGLGEVVVTLSSAGDYIYPGVLVENMIYITQKENVITIPRNALVEKVETVVNPESNTIDLQRSYSVFVSRGDSVAERREVSLGIEQGDKVEVTSGLNPGDQIVVIGQNGLEDQSRITVATGDMFEAPRPQQIESGNGNSALRERGGARGQQGNTPGPLQNMSEEERQEIRQKMRNMTPQERREFLQKLREQQSDSTSQN